MTTIDSSQTLYSLDTDTPLKGGSRKPDEAGGSNGFAEVFAGLHAATARAPASDLAANPPLLQRVELSPAMQLIMPAAPAPDLASLQAFARAQGLDEQAIRQLLGDAPTEAGLSENAKDLPLSAPATAMSPIQAPAQVSTPSPDPTAVTPAAVALAGVALVAWPPLGAGTLTEPGAEPPPSLPLGGLLPPGLVRATQTARPAAPAPEAAASGKTSAWAQPIEVISLDLMAADAPADPDTSPAAGLLKGLEAGQTGLPRTWLLARETATANDVGSSGSSLTVVGRAAGVATLLAGNLSRLDPAVKAANDTVLADEAAALPSGDLLQALQPDLPSGQDSPVPAGRPLGLQEAAATAARGQAPTEAAMPPAAGRDTAEHLAQKMGEAIAQRLISRLEQGNWQFRFVLNPRTMGEVQVNLHMHGGGLDGSFVASHAGTRELLNDGLQRLRDTLNASGMNVASLDVGAGHSSRQGQQSMAAAVPQPSSGSRASAPPPLEGTAPVRHRESFGGEQGWDVLV